MRPGEQHSTETSGQGAKLIRTCVRNEPLVNSNGCKEVSSGMLPCVSTVVCKRMLCVKSLPDEPHSNKTDRHKED